MRGFTPRERVVTALDHREPDRVPISFGCLHDSIHVFGHSSLKAHLGLQAAKRASRIRSSRTCSRTNGCCERSSRTSSPCMPARRGPSRCATTTRAAFENTRTSGEPSTASR